MPTKNGVLRIAVRLQSMIRQLPMASLLHQVGRNQSTHKENRWSLHLQQLHVVVLVLTVLSLRHETVMAQSASTISVNPTSLVFAAEPGGAKPAEQVLTISTSGEQDITWTVSKSASWLKLEPITGTRVTPLTASVTRGSLAAKTYYDEITLAINGTASAKIPVTFVVTSPQNTNRDEEKGFVIRDFKSMSKDPADGGCIKDLSTEPVATGDFGRYISVGPTVAAQAFTYDLASKQVSFNAGGGAGLAVRVYWPPVSFAGDPDKNVARTSYGINQIRKPPPRRRRLIRREPLTGGNG